MSEMKDLIALFKAETEEHLTNLDNGLVKLEKQPDDVELLRSLNREVHTLKGAARVFGFSEIQNIAHRIEDIFEKVSTQQIPFNSYLAEKIFKGLDSIRTLLERIVHEKEIDVDVSELYQDLESCLKGKEEIRKAEQRDIRQKPMGERVQVEPPSDPPPEASSLKEEYLRIPLSRVDNILYLMGEVVIHRMRSSSKVAQAKRLSKLSRELQKSILNLSEMMGKEFLLRNEEWAKCLSLCELQMQTLREQALKLYDHLSTESFQLDPVIDELQARVKKIKMLPLSTVLSGFPRMVRDIASQQGKEVNLIISGGDTELDKKVLENIKTSLIHLLRNCIDHGIEAPEVRISLGKPKTGTIKISAGHEGDNVVITVEDDGRGMDTDQIKQTALLKKLVSKEDLEKMTDKEIFNIVFMNGYSTSPVVTDVSGRGMGLDIVKQEITRLKGRVYLESQKDCSTKFTLVLPLTISIIQVLLVRVQGIVFALPMLSVSECVKVNRREISSIEGRMAFSFRGHTLPLVKLNEVLGIRPETEEEEMEKEDILVVIVSSLDRQVGFAVDEILGDEEVFIKSLGKHLGKVKNVSGAIITPTGEVVVVLDVEDLLIHSALQPLWKKKVEQIHHTKGKRKRILVVEDAFSTRELEKSILENQGYLVDTAVDGLDALNRMTENKYDLILSDIEMPRMDGFELCRTLKRNEGFKEIPFVMVTALQKEEDKRKGMEVGAAAYIVKNAFEQTHLLETIERLVG